MRDRPKNAEDPLEAALEEFQEAWYGGNRMEVDAFCSRHPVLGKALRHQIENFLFVMNGLPAAEGGYGRANLADPIRDIPGTEIGEFRILREIGRGGMGVVYEAEQITLRRKVALKVLSAHLSFFENSVDKFRREAEAGGRQRHPGIVAVYAVGKQEGIHYIAQELVEGGRTLADRLEELRGIDPPQGYFRGVAALIADVADALGHAHESGVIHRDIKPSNILLTMEGLPKVTDFGLAKVEDALALSRTGDFAGTPYYMSPEQASRRRGNIDQRTDIYSLGVTLYEVLTLERPFTGETSQEVFRKILHTEPADPRRINPRVPRDLSVICLKAMEKEADRRYGTMAELAADLRRFHEGEVILAKPVSSATRFLKRLRRNPSISVAFGMAVTAVAALILSVPLYILRIREERDEVGRQREAALVAKAELEAERNRAVEARKEAESQRAAAQASEAEAKAINAFLQSMIASPDPFEDGREVKVVDVLRKAIGTIKANLQGQPRIEASVRNTIGHTYLNLGLFEDAEEQFASALEINRHVLGEEHLDTLHTMNELGTVYLLQRRNKESEALFSKVTEICRRNFGEEHPITFTAMSCLGNLYLNQGRLNEAESITRKILRYKRQNSGEEDQDTLNTMHNLGAILFEQGKLNEAETVLSEVMEVGGLVLDDEHPSVLSSMAILGRIHIKHGKLKEAEALYDKVLETYSIKLGEEHPATLSSMANLGSVYTRQGKHVEAEPLYRKILETRLSLNGEQDPETLNSMYCLGIVLHGQKRFSEAEAQYQKCIRTAQYALPRNHIITSKCRMKLGELLAKLERFDEAEEHLLAAYEGFKGGPAGYQQYTKESLGLLIRLYRTWGKSDRAAVYWGELQPMKKPEKRD